MPTKIRTHRDLEVYQWAFDVSMEIFEISKAFPKDERYLLTDQMRRPSRSTCANLAEAWRQIYNQVLGTIVGMINHPETWLIQKRW